MEIEFHPHAQERILERGTTVQEVKETIEQGERFPAKQGRIGFRRNFSFGKMWRKAVYENKQVEAIVVEETPSHYLVITVMVRFF